MNALFIGQFLLGLAVLPPMRPDTPPPLPVPAARLATLRTMEDVISATLLADGTRAPASLVLPQLLNRRQTLDYMRVYYPESMLDKKSKGVPVAWIHIDAEGKVREAHMVISNGHEALDSLCIHALGVAWFKPALVDGKPVGVWLPFPARIPPHDELMASIAALDPAIATPRKTEYTERPVLLNRNQIEAAIVNFVHEVNQRMVEVNQAFARAQNAGGTVELSILIAKDGGVHNTLIRKTSGNADLDLAAQQIARMMRFSPAKNEGARVEVWLEVPIRFSAQ